VRWPTTRALSQIELLRLTVKLPEALPRVAQTNTVAVFRSSRLRSWAIICDFQNQMSVITSGPQFNPARFRLRFDGVTNRIFDQRLKHQARHCGVGHGWLHLENHVQAVTEADLFNVQK